MRIKGKEIRTKNIFSVVLTTALLILFTLYFLKNGEDFKIVFEIKPIFIVLLSILYSVLFALEGLFIKIVLEAFNKKITVGESFYISSLSRIGNYLLPMRAGIAMRAAYLKKKFKFPYSEFISTLYGYYIILFLQYSFIALLSLGYKFVANEEQYMLLALFFGGIFITMLFFSLIKLPTDKIPIFENKIVNKLLGIIKKIANGWNTIVSKKKTLKNLFLISFANILVNIMIFGTQFWALEIPITLPNISLYSSLAGVSLLISVTPGSLGLREAIFFVTSNSLNLNSQEILQLALLDRGIMFGLLIILSLILILFLNKKYAKTPKEA